MDLGILISNNITIILDSEWSDEAYILSMVFIYF